MTDQLAFDGHVAIVTGAGRGLGRAHALALADRGARVIVNDVGGALDGSGTAEDPAAEVVDIIRASGGEAVVDRSSVATAQGGEAIVGAALAAFGRIDIVVNNAGILRDASFHKLSDDQLDAVLDVHLRGAVHVTRPAWKHFRDQGSGRVINTTSNAGLLGNFGQANYAAAKMGLVGLTHVLAIEGAKYGIKANAIAPVARTRMTDQVLGDLADAVDPSYVSPLVVLLAHDRCPISGEVLSVGAGRVARFFIGATRGWYSGGQVPAPEDILEHLADIEHTDGFEVLPDAMAELALLRSIVEVDASGGHSAPPPLNPRREGT
jgi:NAD(P)-dependent dehydrogenase (short-subunit alcohol dehydrogenase family)